MEPIKILWAGPNNELKVSQWPVPFILINLSCFAFFSRGSGSGSGCVVAMALGHRRSWKITVHAKVNDLYIKFKATVKRPSGKFRSLLNLDKLLVGLDSKSESRILVQQHRTLKSRIISFVKKHFRRRRSKTGVGFKMPDPYLVDETEYQSWRLGRAVRKFFI